MDDLVKRLEFACWRTNHETLEQAWKRLLKDAAEAAAEITRLRAEVKAARKEGLEMAGVWHDKMATETADAFEQELHIVSAAAIRALAEE